MVIENADGGGASDGAGGLNIEVQDQGEGATATIPVSNVPKPEQINYPELKSITPPEYREKGYIKDAKDLPAVFKMLDDAKTFISQKDSVIPGDGATDEQLATYRKAIGVPETPEGYKFPEPQEGQTVNEEFQKRVAGLLHKVGASEKMFNELVPGFDEIVAELGANAQMSDEDFNKEFSTAFGNEADDIVNRVEPLMAEHSHESLQDVRETLNNRQLAYVSSIIDSIAKAHISEDYLPQNGQIPSTVMSEADKVAEGTKLMETEAWENSFDPGHDAMVIRINKLFGTHIESKK